MVKYLCERCGYSTDRKTNILTHLKRKFTCPPTLSDVETSVLYQKYGNSNNIAPKCSEMLQNSQKLECESSISENIILEKIINPIKKKQYECLYCKKAYTRNSNLKRHLITCKKNNQDTIQMESQDKFSKLLKSQNELQNQITNLINKKDNPTNITNIINNVNNTTNIVINNYGNENLSYIGIDELNKFVKNIPPGIMKLIEVIHFNPQHPENKNLRITNKKLPFIQIRKKNKWILGDKNDIINNLLTDKYNILEEHYTNVSNSLLTDTDKRNIDRFRKNYANDNVKQMVKKIEMLILNNSSELE